MEGKPGAYVGGGNSSSTKSKSRFGKKNRLLAEKKNRSGGRKNAYRSRLEINKRDHRRRMFWLDGKI